MDEVGGDGSFFFSCALLALSCIATVEGWPVLTCVCWGVECVMDPAVNFVSYCILCFYSFVTF